MSKRLRRGDKVIAIAGNDKGKSGVVKALRKKSVVVEGLNIRKKHVKRSQDNQAGGIIEIEMPIHISNVRLVHEGKPVALRARTNKKGQKELYIRAGDSEAVYRLASEK